MSDVAASTLLLEYTQDKIAVIDREGTFTYVNKATERILGFDEADLVGDNAFEYIHPEERQSVRDSFGDVVESDETYTAQTATYRHRTSDASWVWLESNVSNLTDSALGGYVVSSREVTDRVEAERKRRKSEERLRELANTTDDVLWMFSGDWEELLFCNPAYEDLFGMTIGHLEADPSHFLDAIHPDDVPAVRQAMERLVDGQSVNMEYRVNPERDYDRWVWVQGEPVESDGEVVRIVGFARDVTHRRRRERQLAVMDNFLRHNLRNRMNAVISSAELLEGELPESEERVAVIRRAATKLLETADKQRDVVDFLRRSLKPQTVALSETVDTVVSTLRGDYPDASISVSVPETATVHAIEEVEYTVMELVENAIRHCGDQQPKITISASVSDETVELTVSDNCRPLPDFDQRVLTGDHETDAVYHSSGCGLWLVYWTIDLSDGSIEYEEDTNGNKITLTLPRAEG